MCDIDGLLTTTRKDGNLEGHKKWYAKDHPPVKDLGQIVKEIKPTILIGASATPGLFTAEILQDMGKYNEKPIVFALSNPTSRAECTAEQAFQNTEVIEKCFMNMVNDGGPIVSINKRKTIFFVGTCHLLFGITFPTGYL